MKHTPERQCSKRVTNKPDWFHTHQCPRKGTVERDGKWYCWQHDPKYRAKKRREAAEKHEREWAAKKAKWDRQARAEEVPSMFDDLGLNPEAVWEVIEAAHNLLMEKFEGKGDPHWDRLVAALAALECEA